MQSERVNDARTALSSSSLLAMKLNKPQRNGLRIIELGAGCGLVGIWISTALPQSNILLTDLPKTMDILGLNISQAPPTAGGSLERMILDWDKGAPDPVRGMNFDLVVVSDCTYNCDSAPALVRTISALLAQTPSALAVVSAKIRHESETIFFDLMSEAGLVQLEHSSITLHSRQLANVGFQVQSVDVYVYQPSDSACRSEAR